MLAHIRGGALVKKYNGPNVRIQCENGDTVSPIFAGYTNGNDRIVPVVPETVGTPGPDTKSTFERIIEADQVIERTTYTAMTAQEITDRDNAEANSVEAEVFTTDKRWRATMMTMRDLAKAVRDGTIAGATDAQIDNAILTRFRANYRSLQ